MTEKNTKTQIKLKICLICEKKSYFHDILVLAVEINADCKILIIGGRIRKRSGEMTRSQCLLSVCNHIITHNLINKIYVV